MSSSLRLALQTQNYDYLLIAMFTTVVYDNVLTFSKEVEHIWMKRWNLMSTLFIMVRYIGFCSLIVSVMTVYIFPALIVIGTDLNAIDLYPSNRSCGIMFVVEQWSFIIFVGAADCAMILRVWAMYNRSRLVLIIVLPFFCTMVISSVVDRIISTTMTLKNMAAFEITHILDMSFCSMRLSTQSVWHMVSIVSQMAHGALLCTLIIIHFVRESIEMYRETRSLELSKYLKLMVKQGIIYFFGGFTIYLLSFLNITSEAEEITMNILAIVPMYSLAPRFIISIRELDANDIAGRCGERIDIGFGFGRDLLTGSHGGIQGTATVFSDVEQNERLENVQEPEIARED